MDRKIIAILAGCLVAAFGWVYYQGGKNATLALRLKSSDSTIVALQQRQRGVDTVYRTDTLRLTRSVTKWRELQHYDTVMLPVPPDTVRLIVATADTTIKACLLVVETCEQRVAVRDSIIATLKAQRPLIEGKGASLKSKVLWGILGAGAGYIGGRIDRE